MMKYLAIVLCLGLLACGEPPTTADRNLKAKIDAGEVAQVAVAPDGTILWGVYTGSRMVYFSGSGAHYTRNCGKNCTESVDVPNI